ncbi:hypothetical protein [Hymenobacter gelipurpurascens]|uniref:hypothetical protein n=1 Tax=Hymenobacter gelipurpurascens TaxID=89968 RepID=UPI001130FD1B|nr:hypothetical protein [Hymenobacter gelipurpurascens]
MLSLLFLCASATKQQEHQKQRLEVKFTLAHREYGWREYGRDSVKFTRPLQYLIDVYQVTYVLNQHEVVLYKTAYQSGATPVRIYSNAISAQHARAFRRIMRRANPDSIASRSNNVWIEDGFQAEVVLTKDRKTTELFWNNNYVPELVALLSIVNATAPEPLKVYPVTKEADFIRYLKATSDYSGYRKNK